MKIRMIPLNVLVPSPANVRKTNAAAGIAELAASIEAHGLLHNLQVRAVGSGKFVAGAAGSPRLGCWPGAKVAWTVRVLLFATNV